MIFGFSDLAEWEVGTLLIRPPGLVTNIWERNNVMYMCNIIGTSGLIINVLDSIYTIQNQATEPCRMHIRPDTASAIQVCNIGICICHIIRPSDLIIIVLDSFHSTNQLTTQLFDIHIHDEKCFKRGPAGHFFLF